MKIYLASAYQSREQIRAYAADLEDAGFDCTSTWLNEEHEINDGTVGAATELDDVTVANHVRVDLYDIRRSDILVIFTESVTGHQGGGGRHVEMGIALERGIPIVVVGTPENIFQRGSSTARCVDWHMAIISLVAIERTMPRAYPMEVKA